MFRAARLRRILALEGLLKAASAQTEISDWAREGNRVVVNGKAVWGGLGNRSGLHSYAGVMIREKWQKSGPRFEAKIDALPPGTEVELFWFKNIDRDRGRWVKSKTLTIPATPSGASAPMPPALLRKVTRLIEDFLQDKIWVNEATQSLEGNPSEFGNATVWKIVLQGGWVFLWSPKLKNELYDVKDREFYSPY